MAGLNVDAALVQWLKDGALYASSTDGAIAAAWGDTAIETQINSPLALPGDAAAEAAGQRGFLSGPLAIETHNVPGLRSDLLGRPVTIVGDNLGYEPGLTVFVIGAEEAEKVERTTLTVLRRLT